MPDLLAFNSQNIECTTLDTPNKQMAQFTFYQPTSKTTADQNKAIISLLRKGAITQYQTAMKFNCANCNLCRPIRINVNNFIPSKSQRRILKQNKDLEFTLAPCVGSTELFDLYKKYLKARHSNSEMNQITFDQFRQKISTADTLALIKDEENIVAFALLKEDSKSIALEYIAFDPNTEHRSLGIFMHLKVIQNALDTRKDHIYLGVANLKAKELSYKTGIGATEVFSQTTETWHSVERQIKNFNNIP